MQRTVVECENKIRNEFHALSVMRPSSGNMNDTKLLLYTCRVTLRRTGWGWALLRCMCVRASVGMLVLRMCGGEWGWGWCGAS